MLIATNIQQGMSEGYLSHQSKIAMTKISLELQTTAQSYAHIVTYFILTLDKNIVRITDNCTVIRPYCDILHIDT
jgi:hypothetical protein